MFELFAFFAQIFGAEAICPNLVVGNSFHLKPQAQDINFFATDVAHSKWLQSQYVHDRFAVRLLPCAAMA
jgi:hypothetical protein